MTSQSISAHFKAKQRENMGNRSVPGMGVREWATMQKLLSDDHQQTAFKRPSNERYFYQPDSFNIDESPWTYCLPWSHPWSASDGWALECSLECVQMNAQSWVKSEGGVWGAQLNGHILNLFQSCWSYDNVNWLFSSDFLDHGAHHSEASLCTTFVTIG